MQSRVIIGLGTGRCGTHSLSSFLSRQPGMSVLHEGTLGGRDHPWRWQDDGDRVRQWVEGLPERLGHPAYCGDVGMYFLPYCELLIASLPGIRFICVERDRAAVVRSFVRHTADRHPWLLHDGCRYRVDPVWDAAYPKFDEPDKVLAAGRYWDFYTAEVNRLLALHPDRFGRFPMEALNSFEGRNAILDFIGYDGERRLDGTFHSNAARGPVKAFVRVRCERFMTAVRPLLPASLRPVLWDHVGRHLHAWLR